jgi:hypothetical protein
MAPSPTSRSLQWLRDEGYDPAVVEVWNRFAPRPGGGRGIRQDLYNFADIIAFRPGARRPIKDILLVQTTSYSCVSARKKKILAEPRALGWLQAGGTIDIHGWHKKPLKKGGRAVWQVRIVHITETDFKEETK